MIRRSLMTCAIAALLLVALGQAARAGAQDFILYNRTGVDIYALYVCPSDSESWEADLLGGSQLIAGADVLIAFDPAEQAQHWDIMVEDQDGNALYWRGIDLISATEVILEDNGVARIK